MGRSGSYGACRLRGDGCWGVIGTPLLVLRKLNRMSMTNKYMRGGCIHVVKVDEVDNGADLLLLC